MDHIINNAVEHLNHAIALDPAFWPALVQKSMILGLTSEWEGALESADRVLAIEGQGENCQALELKALHSYLWYGDAPESVNLLHRLITSLQVAMTVSPLSTPVLPLCGYYLDNSTFLSYQKWEPHSAALHSKIAMVFARICGKSVATLNITTGCITQ